MHSVIIELTWYRARYKKWEAIKETIHNAANKTLISNTRQIPKTMDKLKDSKRLKKEESTKTLKTTRE
jgi:predicted ABC-type ATPase